MDRFRSRRIASSKDPCVDRVPCVRVLLSLLLLREQLKDHINREIGLSNQTRTSSQLKRKGLCRRDAFTVQRFYSSNEFDDGAAAFERARAELKENGKRKRVVEQVRVCALSCLEKIFYQFKTDQTKKGRFFSINIHESIRNNYWHSFTVSCLNKLF